MTEAIDSGELRQAEVMTEGIAQHQNLLNAHWKETE
jgi:hypothetical protein